MKNTFLSKLQSPLKLARNDAVSEKLKIAYNRFSFLQQEHEVLKVFTQK